MRWCQSLGVLFLAVITLAIPCAAPAGLLETYDVAEAAYVYASPIIAADKAMCEFNVDLASP